ncbi:zf-HC2 domain-containing protein [Actinokineospora soli]|uniref:Zf-HC2 domain-containing protein n=1 Tax=Actinokineospora soli TaxID=1048753 RepID=A0ABW2TUJ5_9PSEU
MTNADVHALTGAYALNAIPELERAAFERHLAECDACAQEVAELQATAARLGEAAAEAPPPELKAAVMAGIKNIRQLPPVGGDGAAAPRPRAARGRCASSASPPRSCSRCPSRWASCCTGRRRTCPTPARRRRRCRRSCPPATPR